MEKNKHYQNWVVTSVVLLLFGIAVAATQFKVPVIMPLLMKQYAMDTSSASWLMSIFTFVGIGLAVPTGALAKRFGPKALLIVSAGILVVGSAIGLLATSAALLLLSRGIEGVAFIIVTICGPLAVQRYVAPEKIGSATGVWALWVALGSVIGGVVTPTLLTSMGFAFSWIAYAAFAALIAIIIGVEVKFPKGERAQDAGLDASAGNDQKASYAELFKPNTLLFYAAFLVFQIVTIAVLSFSPTWLQTQGIDPTLSGFISTLPMLLAIVSSPLIGSLSDKTGKCKPFLVAGMLSMGPCAFLLLNGSGIALWSGAIIMGLIGMGTPVMMLTSYPRILGKAELLSIGMGFLMLVQSLGQFLGTLISPILLGAAGDQWFFLGMMMCIFGLAGTALAAVCKFK